MEDQSEIIESHTQEDYEIRTAVEQVAKNLANVSQYRRNIHAHGVHESENHVILKKETWEAIGKRMGWLE